MATGGLVIIEPGDGLRPRPGLSPSDPPQAAASDGQGIWTGYTQASSRRPRAAAVASAISRRPLRCQNDGLLCQLYATIHSTPSSALSASLLSTSSRGDILDEHFAAEAKPFRVIGAQGGVARSGHRIIVGHPPFRSILVEGQTRFVKCRFSSLYFLPSSRLTK